MKIQRVETKSFAISEGAEKKLYRRLSRGSLKRLINKILFREDTEVIKSYKPLGKFRLSRLEETHKGVVGQQTVYETKQNNFYVDLSNADIYMIRGHQILRDDILKKLMSLPPQSVRLLGELMRKTYLYADELDKGAILDLAHLGYITIYKSTLLTLFDGLWNELNPESPPTVVRDRVKATHRLPSFVAGCYDLGNHLIEIDTIDEDYTKDKIRYPVDTISQLLAELFDAKVVLLGITFIPCLSAYYSSGGGQKIKSPSWHYPVCFKGEILSKRKEGTKLKPIALSTAITAEGVVPVEEPTIDFSDVGGMEEIKKEIWDTLILPLLKPEVAKEFGKNVGGAILLYGPPGCGKTYIAKAAIGEVGLPFYNVNISEIVGRGTKAEAESLHEVFEEARKNSPAVIFFDEIDAIGGRREGSTSYEQKMEVDQFLMEMDGVETLGKDILILAATNAPWNIDPALRRSVRFTKQVFVPPPDVVAREEIFRIHTRGRPVDFGLDYRRLAELTEGYAASDIKAICDRAIEIPWQEAVEGEPPRKVTMDDFLKALSEQKSSLIPWFKMAYKELKKRGEEKFFEDFAKYIIKYGGGVDQVEKPEIKFSDVGGMEEIKEEIRKAVIYPIKNPEISKDYRKKVGGAILLYGPPGCGKTYIAKATAGECDVAFFNVKLTDILSNKPGESEKNIQEIFEKASNNTPAILFFDELDAITGRRDQAKSELSKRLIESFLTELDGFKEINGLFILAATNAPWNIDPALRRSVRFTKQVFVPPPDVVAREEIFRIHTRGRPVDFGLDYRRLAELTEGYAASDIKAICDRAIEIPWQEAVEGGRERRVTMADFMEAIEQQKSSLLPWYLSAEKKIKESGEQEFYSELAKNIRDFIDSTAKEKKIEETLAEEKKRLKADFDEEDIKISELRAELERKIEAVRKRYYQREIDDNVFKKILGDYEEQLIELDVKMEILNSKRKGMTPEEKKTPVFDVGKIYIIKEKGLEKSIAFFMKEAEKARGLWVSRTNAERIRSEYKITQKNIAVLWLTSSLTYKEAIPPLTPNIFAVLTDFIDSKERGVILLEGIEYMITHNGFEMVLNMFQSLKDKISLSNTLLFLPVAPETLTEREMALLEKEAEIVN